MQLLLKIIARLAFVRRLKFSGKMLLYLSNCRTYLFLFNLNFFKLLRHIFLRLFDQFQNVQGVYSKRASLSKIKKH